MKNSSVPKLVFSDGKGRVFAHPEWEALGMKAGRFFPLDPADFVKLPNASEMFLLPGRRPIGIDPEKARPSALASDPYSKKNEPCFAVAAFIPPGYTLTHNAAYREMPGAAMLPLFAYGPCFEWNGDFYTSAVHVDKSFRHDERFLDVEAVRRGTDDMKKLFPSNRLVPHLTNCALVNGCANAKNFFLNRFEAPIPSSPACNAQCQGCISLQPAGREIPSTQPRIGFTPAPEEIAELVLYHFDRAADPLTSFGQGCEGEPTLSGDVIEKAIRLIRAKTSKGVINVNTNASRPKTLARLFEAGLDSIRVSTNSVREPYYSRYYQPKGYSLAELFESMDVAKKNGAWVSMNYLSMPGFTDSEGEAAALGDLLASGRVDMIQWRNLNYDPLSYFRDLGLEGSGERLLGMRQAIRSLEKNFPKLRMGYFNPRKLVLS